MTQPSSNNSRLFQALEKRFMFDAAAASTVEKAVDLSDGASAHEQQEVMAALAANSHVIQTQSLMDALGEHLPVNEDYTQIKEVILIDSRVLDPQQIIAGIGRDAAVEIVNFGQDGVTQIAAILANYHNLDAVHIISHGSDGELELGNTILNLSNINQHASELAAWGQSLTATGDILLYGCNVAEDATGISFVQALSQLTSADIAASTDTTGGDTLAGDWNLEYHKDVEKTSIVDEHDYAHLLAATYSNADATVIYNPMTTTIIEPNIVITLDPGEAIGYFRVSPATGGGEILGIQADNTFGGGEILGIQADNTLFAYDNGFTTYLSTQAMDSSNFNTVAFATMNFNSGTSILDFIYSGVNQMTAEQVTLLARHVTFSQTNTSSGALSMSRTFQFRATVVDNYYYQTINIHSIPGPYAFGDANNPSYSAGQAPVNVFSAISSYTNPAASFSDMSLTVSNIGSGDSLSFADDSGTKLAIDHNGSVAYSPIASPDIMVNVSVSGTTATISLSSMTGVSISNTALNSLLSNLQFTTTNTSAAEKVFTLVSLTDTTTGPNSVGLASTVHVASTYVPQATPDSSIFTTTTNSQTSNSSSSASSYSTTNSTSSSTDSISSSSVSSFTSSLESLNPTTSLPAPEAPVKAAPPPPEPASTPKAEPVKAAPEEVAKNLMVTFKDSTDAGKINTLNKLNAYLKNVSAEEVSKIASSIYESAVADAKNNNNSALLEKVVNTLTSAIKNEKALDAFLEKVASDTRVTVENRSDVVNYLIDHGKQKEAQLLLAKLDKATGNEKGPGANCT